MDCFAALAMTVVASLTVARRRRTMAIVSLRSFVMRMIFRCDPALSDHLPRPVAARGALPDWLRAMPAKAGIQ